MSMGNKAEYTAEVDSDEVEQRVMRNHEWQNGLQGPKLLQSCPCKREPKPAGKAQGQKAERQGGVVEMNTMAANNPGPWKADKINVCTKSQCRSPWTTHHLDKIKAVQSCEKVPESKMGQRLGISRGPEGCFYYKCAHKKPDNPCHGIDVKHEG